VSYGANTTEYLCELRGQHYIVRVVHYIGV